MNQNNESIIKFDSIHKEYGDFTAVKEITLEIAKGELFFIVDSDDTLLSNSIEKINQWAATLDGSRKWAGISGLKGYATNKVVGQQASANFIDAKNTERYKYHLEGDKAEVYFT